MKKEELITLLNKEADSIDLHDATLHCFEWINNSITFTIGIGSYHYIINDLEDIVDDLKDRLVLTLRFDGIKNIEFDVSEEFMFEGCEILENNAENDTFEFILSEWTYRCNLKFKYDSFKWDVVGEFDDEQIKQWYKENGLYKGLYEDI